MFRNACSNSWSNSLIVWIYPAVSARRHIVISPPYKILYIHFSILDMHGCRESHINHNLTHKSVLPDAGGEHTTFESFTSTWSALMPRATEDMTKILPPWRMSWLPTSYSTQLKRNEACKFTVYPKKYAHGFCFAVLCCGYTLTDCPISIRLTSLALWQSNDCPSASKATLMNMDKYFMWIHYERLHNHNKTKHNKTVCIFLGIYCRSRLWIRRLHIHPY